MSHENGLYDYYYYVLLLLLLQYLFGYCSSNVAMWYSRRCENNPTFPSVSLLS